MSASMSAESSGENSSNLLWYLIMPSTRAKFGLEQMDLLADASINDDSTQKREDSAKPQNVFLTPTGDR